MIHPLRRAGRAVRARWRRYVAPTTLWRAIARFESDTMTDMAATLGYYSMLSLFPGLLLGIFLLGLLGGDGLVADLVSFSQDRGANSATADVVRAVARGATRSSAGALSAAIVVSLLLTLNAASGVFNAAGRAVNRAHDVAEDRSFVHRRLTVYGLTLVTAVLFAISMSAIVIGGDLARGLFDLIGLGTAAADTWDLARWPVALVLAMATVGVVLRYAPAAAARSSSLVTAGSVLTVVLWIVATIGFSFYVRRFAHYGALYGTFSTAVVVLLWLYLMAVAFLLGAELDGERERRGRAA